MHDTGGNISVNFPPRILSHPRASTGGYLLFQTRAVQAFSFKPLNYQKIKGFNRSLRLQVNKKKSNLHRLSQYLHCGPLYESMLLFAF